MQPERLCDSHFKNTNFWLRPKKTADDIAMIHKGEISWRGEANQVNRSGNPYVEQFINGRAEGPIQMDVLRP